MMGALCSTDDKEGNEPSEGKAQALIQVSRQSNYHRRLHKMPQAGLPERSKPRQASANSPTYSTEAEYNVARAALIQAEKATAFDAQVIATASEIEKKASKIVRGIRNYDWDNTYKMPPSSKRVDEDGNIRVENAAGEHFLSNVDLINKTELFKVARKMPKGAHLHVHFNSCLPPKFLIREARKLPDTMWICSSRPLINDAEFRNCRIQFNVFNADGVAAANKKLDIDQKASRSSDTNIFTANYLPMRWMKYQDFISQFDWTDYRDGGRRYHGINGVEDWLERKMVFSAEEAYGVRQTSRGYVMTLSPKVSCLSSVSIWERFNFRTQMMKGLFAYETAYRSYTSACIKDFVDDNIQYAEVRPNFMTTNQLKTDDGSSMLNNEDIMRILDDGVRATLAEIEKEGHYFADMKVIYCTPRSFNNDATAKSLNECIELKKKFSHLICGRPWNISPNFNSDTNT